MDKKNIAVLLVGEIRSNSLGTGNNNEFIETFNRNILNDAVLNEYNVNIFFVTDKLCKERTIEYFKSNLKGLLQVSCETIEEETEVNLQEIFDNYLTYYECRKNNSDKYPIKTAPRESQIHKFYKLFLAYKLMKKYEDLNGFQHDYIVKIRPDSSTSFNFYNDIKTLEHNNLHMLFSWDYAYFGTYDIMSHVCKLIFVYGKYNYGEMIHDINYTRRIYANTPGVDYADIYYKCPDWASWLESPEVQLAEHILEYCYKKNISFYKLFPYFNNFHLFEDRLLFDNQKNEEKVKVSGLL